MKKFISKVLICAMLISVLPKTSFAHEEKVNTTTVSEEQKAKTEKLEKKEEVKSEEKVEKKEEVKAEEKAEKKEEAKAEEKAERKEEVKSEEKLEQPAPSKSVKARENEEPDKFSVIFIFVSGTEGMDLPNEVLNKTPQILTDITSGTEINLPTFEDVKVEGGTWKFTGWSLFPEARGTKAGNLGNTIMVDGNLELQGEWVFEKATPTYFIEFEFKSITDGKDLPQEVLNKLPEKQTDIPSNSTVTLPEMTDVKVDGGTWKFVRWTWAAYYRGTRDAGQDNFVYVDQDLLVTGEWEYVEDPEPEKFNVTFEFKSVTPGKELPDEIKAKLPPNQTDVDNGTVIPLEKYENVKVEGGTWVFNYWYIEKDGNQVIKENEAVVEGEDLNLIGEWAFEADDPEPEKYDVTFRFVSVTPGKELPQAVLDKLPPNQIGVDNGTLITLPILEDVKVDGGTWKFVKWLVEKEDGMHVVQAGPMVQDEDLKLVGEWRFEEDKKPEPPKPLKPQKPKVQKGRILPKTNVESAFTYVVLALAGIGGAYIAKKKDNE